MIHKFIFQSAYMMHIVKIKNNVFLIESITKYSYIIINFNNYN